MKEFDRAPERCPKAVFKVRGKICVPPSGPLDAKIAVVSSFVLSEDLDENVAGKFVRLKLKPRLDRGACGQMLKDALRRAGIDPESVYRTCLIKCLPDKNPPSKQEIDEWFVMFEAEMARVCPEIVVCLGRQVFDEMLGRRYKAADIEGGFFWSEQFKCKIILLPLQSKMAVSPDQIERFVCDFKEVARELSGRKDSLPRHYSVISTADELQQFVAARIEENSCLVSCDCEWHGKNHVDGMLRSLQLAWAPGKAVYVRFMDDDLNYAFDGADYWRAGKILSQWLDRSDVKYVGHHISADLPWMHVWLGLNWYRKTFLDTEFAQQTLNEYSELGLERLALRYTDLGRYDVDLTVWCKENADKAGNGYGYVPDDILIEYACRDADAAFRIAMAQIPLLIADEVWDYYQNIRNPFVTDVFTYFILEGLPVDKLELNRLRKLFVWVRDTGLKEFQSMIVDEASALLFDYFIQNNANPEDAALALAGDETAMRRAILAAGDPGPVLEHWRERHEFNHKTYKHMARWLFEVKKYKPVKSTPNREKGMPAIAWEKVMEFPPDIRKSYSPSTDKQTLSIIAEKDNLVSYLLMLKAVSSQVSSFTGEPDEDGESDGGLAKWICKDGRIRSMISTTETNRPRTWNPNSLNFPKWVSDKISKLAKSLIEKYKPPFADYYLKSEIPSVRSLIIAQSENVSEDWCFVESDYQTAEIRGLAYISGDENLIRLIEEPDTDFGVVIVSGKKMPVRIKYSENSGIRDKDPQCLMSVWKDGKKIANVSEADLLCDAAGNLEHPKADLHWSLAEMVSGKPREKMISDVQRAAAKVANFSSAYGASPNSLERKIEADTGKKPEAGAGQALLSALAERQPDADEFLRTMEKIPARNGVYVAASGAKRRPFAHPDAFDVDFRIRNSLLSSLGREMRNFPMQESVAATSARAGINLLRLKMLCGLRGGPCVILYDSVVTRCPAAERVIWKLAHELFMFVANGWVYHGRLLRYPIDTDFCFRWSGKPSAEEKARLENPEWNKTPQELRYIEAWLLDQIHCLKHKQNLPLDINWASLIK